LPLRGAVFGVRFRRRSGAASLAFQRFYAMLVKHAIHSWRSRVLTLVQLLLPVLLTLLGFSAMLSITTQPIDPPPLLLSLDRFSGPAVPLITVGGPRSVSGRLSVSYSAALADMRGRPVDVGGAGDMDDFLLDVADRSPGDYRRHYFMAATANGTTLVGHFNNFALHSIAVSLSLADNAVLRYAVPGNSRIETINHPLPRSFVFTAS